MAGRLMVDWAGAKQGTVGGGALEERVIQTAKEILQDKDHRIVSYDLSGGPEKPGFESVPMVCGGQITIFYEYISPLPRLLIFGSGNVGGALIKKMQGAGFDLIACDRVKPEDLGQGAYVSDMDEAVDLVREDAYVVISTGSHDVDYDILKAIVTSEKSPYYLGMLASKKKLSSMLKKLKEESGKEVKEIYSPIGLDIGGDSPDEIAISIAAQLVAKKYGKKGNKDLSQ
jgi:xanthine dehydrogenase accessory factor